MSDKPFTISSSRVAMSPFKTVANAKKYLDLYNKGHSIGFTYTSSLKSLGLIPRADGKFVLGQKYR